MSKTILISGGTGLIGTKLTDLLLSKGYKIHLLSRDLTASRKAGVKTFLWDVYGGNIDPECIKGADAVIHLAGEDIAGARWTEERKKLIVESRTKSIELIYGLMAKSGNQITSVISASAVGYYGSRGQEILNENSLPGKDFLAETCIAWENAVDQGNLNGVRLVKLRTGIVLDEKGGALPQLAAPVKLRLGIITGSGKQWVPWIHIDDVVNIYLFALENDKLEGVFNMAAPEPVQMTEMIKCIAKANGKTAVPIKVPEFAMKMALGEMSVLPLSSTRTNASKLVKAGYNFRYTELLPALKAIFGK